MAEQLFIQGPVGKIEVFVDYPQGEVKGFAVVCHPHPLQGGTPQHKVPTLLAQMFLERGYIVYRPSFRGSAPMRSNFISFTHSHSSLKSSSVSPGKPTMKVVRKWMPGTSSRIRLIRLYVSCLDT